MGEDEKKPEEKKIEGKKVEELKKPQEAENKGEEAKPETEEKKEEKKSAVTPPPPQEVVLQIFMHCEGCAKKIRKCLINFPGVEDVITDCKTSKVIVKGEKAAADPLKVLERVQKKSHKKVELLSPIWKPPTEEEKKAKEEPEKSKPEEKKEEPQPITTKLKVHMHCEACAEEIKKRILRMKGVDNAEPDLKSSVVIVTGLFDPPKLVEYVYKRTGKHAMIVPEPEKKEEVKEKDSKEEIKAEDEKKDVGDEKKDVEEAKTEEEIIKMVEMKRNEYYYHPQKYAMEYNSYPPPDQIFSDENPNACSVM